MSRVHKFPSPAGRGVRGEGESKPKLPYELKVFARDLRQTRTDAEGLMWSVLRGRRFVDLKFRRQHPLPPYVLDFYCEELKLAVELDGGQHNQDSEQRRDHVRNQQLRVLGIEVARYWNHDVLLRTESVLEDLYGRVLSRRLSLTPGPSPCGRGENEARP